MALLKFINPATKYKSFNLIWLFALLVFPIVLWVLPMGFFDNTGVELCPSKAFFNYECLGCGMTRAVMHMHHLDWADAIYFNYGIIVVYPALVVIWFLWTYKAYKRHRNFIVKNQIDSLSA